MPTYPTSEQCQFRPCTRKQAAEITWCGRSFRACSEHAQLDGGHASTCRCAPPPTAPPVAVDELAAAEHAETGVADIAAAVLAAVDQLDPDGQLAVLRFAETLASQQAGQQRR